jgi:hypothetical protein
MIRFSDLLFTLSALLLVAAPWINVDGRLVVYGMGVAVLLAGTCSRFILKD